MVKFLAEAVLISLSGVMAPGPVTTAAIGRGSQSPHAGALVAIGHGIVEFPLMALMFFGFGHLLDLPYVKAASSFVGGLFLLTLGVGMFRSINGVEASPSTYGHSPMVAGILLTLGNPCFLIWWATVGATLILRSAQFGTAGFLVFALGHWLCDFFWDYFLSILSFRGGRFFGQRFQRVVFAICAAFLLFYGAKSIVDAVQLVSA